MLDNEGYGRFGGFTPYKRTEQWLIKHQNEAVDLALEAAEYANGVRSYDQNEIDLYNRVKDDISKVKNNGYQSLGPAYYVFPNHPVGYRERDTQYNISGKKGWYIAITVPAFHNDVYVHLNTYPSKSDDFCDLFAEYAAELAEIIRGESMTVWTSSNSLNTESAPEEYGPKETSEIVDIFENRAGSGHYKRLGIGWNVSTQQPASSLVEETGHKMERIHDIFYEEVRMRQAFGN